MIPVNLKIKGFLSYAEQVDLNFDNFDLACISGSNGAGKSSLLDAITWVLFGEARGKDAAVINHFSSAAEVVFDFDYENLRYRVQRSKPKDKSTSLDFFIQSLEEGWKPLTEATLGTTQERIRQTLRLDFETFTNASFFLQGKADQFAQQRPGDRKRILASVLGLEIWEQYKEETLRRRRGVESEINKIDGVLKEIEDELAETDARKSNYQSLKKEYESRKELAETRKVLLDQQRLFADRFENEKKQIEKQELEVKRLHAELDKKVDDLRIRQDERRVHSEQLENEKSIRAEHEGWLAAQKKLQELETVADNFRDFESRRQKPLIKIETERASLQTEWDGLTSTQVLMERLQKELPTLAMQVEECRLAIKKDTDKLEMRPVLEKDLRDLSAEKARVKAENTALKIEMDELKERITTLSETKGAVCPTCEKPLNSAERHRMVDDLNNRGKEKGDLYRENQKIFDHCDHLYREKDTELVSLQQIDADIKLQQRLFDLKSEELRKNQADLEFWNANGLPRWQQVKQILEQESFAPEARTELARLNEELIKLGYDPETHEELRQLELKGRESQQKILALEAAKSALIPLEREISDLQISIDRSEEHVRDLERELNLAKQELASLESEISNISKIESEYFTTQAEANQLLTEVGYAQNQVDVLKVQKQQKEVKLAEKQVFNEQIMNLKMLEKAFSKDGIPALLIEQALPDIENHANEILDKLSNGNMSVKFETQRDYRDRKREDRKETLDIMIRDAAGEREYEMFSGGEAFRVNFAIRLALSRVLSNRSGARLQTLVIDEGFGSQDADGRQRLIEAINLVRPDFAKILVITHLEELKDAFPARIEVYKENASGSKIRVVAA